MFSEWNKTMQYLSTVENFRNAIAHNRDVTPTQQQLLNGIAGEITDDIYLWRIGTSAEVKEQWLSFVIIFQLTTKRMTKLLPLQRRW